MIRKLKSGGYRLYSRKLNPKTGRRRNLGTFNTRAGAEKHERAVVLQAPLRLRTIRRIPRRTRRGGELIACAAR